MVDAGALLANLQQPQGFMLWVDKVARAPLSQVLIFVACLTVLRFAAWWVSTSTPVHRRTWVHTCCRVVNEASDAVIYAGVVVFMLIRPFAIQTFWIPTGSMLQTLQLSDYIVANKFIYRVSDPKINDIVVFRPPVWALQGGPPSDYIKRVVGLPGDVVEIRDKVLYRNGKPVEEPFVTLTTQVIVNRRVTFPSVPKAYWDGVFMPDFKLVDDNGEMIPVQYVLARDGQLHSANVTLVTVAKYRVDTADHARQRHLYSLPPAPVPPGYFMMMGDNRNGSLDSRGWGLVPRESLIGRSEFIWFPLGRWGRTR